MREVGPVNSVLYGVQIARGKGQLRGISYLLVTLKVFQCVRTRETMFRFRMRKVAKISVRTIYQWIRVSRLQFESVVSYEIEIGL